MRDEKRTTRRYDGERAGRRNNVRQDREKKGDDTIMINDTMIGLECETNSHIIYY